MYNVSGAGLMPAIRPIISVILIVVILISSLSKQWWIKYSDVYLNESKHMEVLPSEL